MKKILVLVSILIFSCSNDPQNCDILIENGIIYDGTGNKPYKGVVAISNDKIIYVGKNKNFVANKVIDATDKAVSPGFINMLSWAYNSLMNDGRSLSDLKQGVTLEVFGEGTILNYEGEGANARVEVNFTKEGIKWLVLSFANLKKV